MAVAKGVDSHAAKVESAIDDVSADDVALIEEYFVAEVANDPGARANGDQWVGASVLDRGAIAVLEMDDGKHAIGAHFIAGGVYHERMDVGARHQIDRVDTAREGEVADEHVDAVIEIAIDVVDKFVVAEGESSAGFARVSAEPRLLIENRAGLAPDAEMLALAVAIKAFLPG